MDMNPIEEMNCDSLIGMITFVRDDLADIYRSALMKPIENDMKTLIRIKDLIEALAPYANDSLSKSFSSSLK